MGNGTSIRKFNGLTTAGEGVFFDVGALSRNASSRFTQATGPHKAFRKTKMPARSNP
jgi:hypothetical protein